MSRETDSALLPEEWRQRGFMAPWPVPGAEAHGYDGELEGRDCPIVYVRGNGSLGVDNSAGEYGCRELDARKVMALANLSLTLESKEGAITVEDADVCNSAAWYFRKLARELTETASKISDEAERSAFLDHARSLSAGNHMLLRLAKTLRALVPPRD